MCSYFRKPSASVAIYPGVCWLTSQIRCLLLGSAKALALKACPPSREFSPKKKSRFQLMDGPLPEMYAEIRLGAGLYNVLNQCRFLETSNASFINHLRCFSGRSESGSPTCKQEKEERHDALTSHHIECKYYEIPPPSYREQKKANKGSEDGHIAGAPPWGRSTIMENRVSSEKHFSGERNGARQSPSRFTLDDYKVLLFWGHSKRLFCFPFIIERRRRRQNIG